MQGEVRGGGPHDGKQIDLPSDTIAVVLITDDPLGLRAQYLEIADTRINRAMVAWCLLQLAADESMV